MKIRRGLAAILAAGMLLGSTACVPVEESLPEDTIEEYEDAYNAMDIQAMLDCIDEDSVKSITAGMDVVMGLAGAVAGVDLGISASDLIDLAPLMQAMMGDAFATEMGGIPQVDFQVKETYIKGNRATVYFIEANTGENMVINMVKKDGKWYMTLSTITISKEEADRVIIAGENEEAGNRKSSEKGRLSEEEKKSLFEAFDKSLNRNRNEAESDTSNDQEDVEISDENQEDNERNQERDDLISELLGTKKIKEAIMDILELDDK